MSSCHLQWRNWAELPTYCMCRVLCRALWGNHAEFLTWLCSYNIAVRPAPTGHFTLHNIFMEKCPLCARMSGRYVVIMHVSLMIFVKKACLLHRLTAVSLFPVCNWSKFHSAWPIMMKGQPFLWIPSFRRSCGCLKYVCLFGQKWNASEGKQYLYCISFRPIFKLPWFPLCLLQYINLCEVFFIIKQSGLSRSFVLLPVALEFVLVWKADFNTVI